ncbi:MAG: glycosyltransferase, partial [Betaproteobacteria bacterium]
MVLGLAASWLIFSTWWSLPWFLDLGRQLGSVAALILIALIALIPGFFNSFLLFGLMFDRRPRSSRLASYPSISILIAAYNEEKTLSSTIESIFHSRYPGEIEVLLINDG